MSEFAQMYRMLKSRYTEREGEIENLREQLAASRKAAEICKEQFFKVNDELVAMWGRMSVAEELATNIRRNIKHMARGINAGDQHTSVLLDYLNHMDTLAQQIETGLAVEAYRESEPKAVPVDDLIEKIVEYGAHRENEGGSYATFQKFEARRYRADADEVLVEIRTMLAAQQNREKGQ